MKLWSPSVLLAVQGSICIFFVAGLARAQSVTTTSVVSLPTAPGPVSIPSTSPSTAPYFTQTSSPTTIYTGSDSSSTGTSASSTSSAEYPSLSGVPTCVVHCFDTAIAYSNCTTVVDVNCFCVSGRFPQEIVSCISATCPSELSTAEQLSQQFCNVASSHPTLSFPTPTTTASSASGTATPTAISSPSATSATATATQSTSAAGRGRGDGGTVVLMGLVVGAVGMLIGALYV